MTTPSPRGHSEKARLVCWMLGTLSSDQKFIKEAARATGRVPMGHVPQNLDPRAERLALILYRFGESGFSKHRAPLVDSGEETVLQPDTGHLHLHLHGTRLPASVRHMGSQAVLGLCQEGTCLLRTLAYFPVTLLVVQSLSCVLLT